MPIHTEQTISKLRRMIAETAADSIYTDEILSEMLDAWKGDLNATAAEIWDEKAAAVAASFDFEADGGKYTQSQLVAQYGMMAAKFRSRADFIFPEGGCDAE